VSTQHRSALRLLAVLRVLNRHPFCRLAELHKLTGLPKPTLLRLLGALTNEGYLHFDRITSIYSVTQKVQELGSGFTGANRIVSVAAPILLRETKRMKWPLAIGVLEESEMVVRFSTMPYSPLAVMNTSFGHRHTLLRSALGRAYLVACPVHERRRLLAQVGATEASEDFVDARRLGYGTRLPKKRGDSATLSLPMRNGRGSPLGALSMTTFGRTMTGDFVARALPEMRRIAAEIVLAHQRLGRP
jgi:IclR family mhp operon transcriptional activator